MHRCIEKDKERAAGIQENPYRRKLHGIKKKNKKHRNEIKWIVKKAKENTLKIFCQKLSMEIPTTEICGQINIIRGENTSKKIPILKIPIRATTGTENANASCKYFYKVKSNESL